MRGRGGGKKYQALGGVTRLILITSYHTLALQLPISVSNSIALRCLDPEAMFGLPTCPTSPEVLWRREVERDLGMHRLTKKQTPHFAAVEI